MFLRISDLKRTKEMLRAGYGSKGSSIRKK